MTTIYEIPFQPVDQKFNVTLGGVFYHMRLMWDDQGDGAWILDINDQTDTPLIHGIPLVGGADLLGQYGYMKFGGYLYCVTDGQPYVPPTKDNLGKNSHLVWQPYEP